METIPKIECEKIGFFRKTHGVFGDLVLEFEPQYEITIEESKRFFVELDGLLVPFFLVEDGFRFKTANSAILTFNGVETERYAKRMVGQSVYLFKNEIIKIHEEPVQNRFLNYLLIDEKLGEIGIIQQIDDYSGNLVMTVIYREQELLVPLNNDFLIEVNESRKTLTLALPEGLMDF